MAEDKKIEHVIGTLEGFVDLVKNNPGFFEVLQKLNEEEKVVGTSRYPSVKFDIYLTLTYQGKTSLHYLGNKK